MLHNYYQNMGTVLSTPNGHLPMGQNHLKPRLRSRESMILGMVSRLSDVISREMRVNIRNISVNSNEGLFEGTIKVFVMDTAHLDVLLHKILRIKGVLKASRYDEPGAK